MKTENFNLMALILNLSIATQLVAQGSLLLVGGGGENYNSWSDIPYGWFVARADSDKVINIDVSNASSWYPSYFKSLGAAVSSKRLQISTRSAANDSAVYHELVSAKGIFIEGGDQYDYVSTWKGTLVEDAIHAVFANGGAIGGTSAGLAVLGEIVFDARYGSAYPEETAYNPYDRNIHFEDDFLHILPNILTDSHFYSRGRIGRLVPMLARRIQDNGNEDITGIAVTDKSALCIEADLTATAYGMATVTILYPKARSYIECVANQPLTFTNIGFDQLIHGVTYDLKTKQVIDPGPDLQEVNFVPDSPVYTDTAFAGSNSLSADLAETVITNIYSDDLNAWYGHLGQSDGQSIVPGTIIMPRIWELDHQEENPRLYFENRWIGGMFGLVNHQSFTTIYIDNTSSATVYSNGEIESNGLMYILDLRQATFAGFTSTRNTDFPGIIGAELHFFGSGERYNLITHSPVTTIDWHSPVKPSKTYLYDLYPNPFNPRTTIQYDVAHKGPVTIEIYNSIGAKLTTVTDRIHSPGLYRIRWQPIEFSSGIYFVRLTTTDDMQTKKAVLLK